MTPLFDTELRARRRDRAFRIGPALFLHERAFDDVLERLSIVRRRFSRALLLGCPDPSWRERLVGAAEAIEVRDPGPLFATAAGGSTIVEDQADFDSDRFDLVVTVGTLDTVNDLPRALVGLRRAMTGDALLIGAVAGGETLPRLRSAMRAADETVGAAAPHVHPRIEAASLGPLLAGAGFALPVVDVDRVPVSYAGFDRLVADLRAMGATNILCERPRMQLGRRALAAARATFAAGAPDGRVVEQFELLHFAAWTPQQG